MKSFPEHLTSPQRPLYVPASGMTGQANDPDMVTMRPGAADPPLLQARGIQKRYEAVVALGNGSLEVRAGEVMGLVGDNGAGKSTLVKCLSGVVTPDAGEILFEGQPINLGNAGRALGLGIETVYQDLSLVDPMTAMQNVFLGREELSSRWSMRPFRVLDDRRMRVRAAEILLELGVKLPSLDIPVHKLSGGQRQALAIARAQLWGRRIVLLDEPTAALGVEESRHVLNVIVRLRDRGVGIVTISHNLQHLLSIADRVTVLRHGETVGVVRTSDTSAEDIVALITGAAEAGAAGRNSE